MWKTRPRQTRAIAAHTPREGERERHAALRWQGPKRAFAPRSFVAFRVYTPPQCHVPKGAVVVFAADVAVGRGKAVDVLRKRWRQDAAETRNFLLFSTNNDI